MLCLSSSAQADVAREWSEALLDAIRGDQARPTIHARNLYHVSAGMWDAWAVYDPQAQGVFFTEKHPSSNPTHDRHIAISYAAYRLLSHRFAQSASAVQTQAALDQLMLQLGLDTQQTTTTGNAPTAIGNRIAAAIIQMGMQDGSNEVSGYANAFYLPINDPLVPDLPGNPDITDPNRWQPLALDYFIDQSGVVLGDYPDFLSPEWGDVTTFSMTGGDVTQYTRDGNSYQVYKDPGPPPLLGTATDDDYRTGFEQVVEFSATLDPSSGNMIDISPATRGNNSLGHNDGQGRALNPITGQPYQPQVVPAGDYFRVLAEFWADGPDSETPPGHWFTILNYVSDHPQFEKRWQGQGPIMDDLEWEVKSYLAMGGAMHDAAVAAWSVKGWYDYTRPISAIRYMCDNGQSSDPQVMSYDPNGIRLDPGLIELVTPSTVVPGGRHEHLAGFNQANVGKVALYAWRGPDHINDPNSDTAGVGWILCENWWPYQRPTFVTPPFAGYVSGHSTFSRTAAEVMTQMTGTPFFPGGMGEFQAPMNAFLVFEQGPSQDITLQWATYQDASDECSLSRIYGGIHPTADDIPGRLMGFQIGHQAFARANQYFFGPSTTQVPLHEWAYVLMVLFVLVLARRRLKIN